ncbi:MAG: thioredoxin reductase [Armatimonadetes bacterium]|nr:thioredoxin reductase [Armatimonadota bacterium]
MAEPDLQSAAFPTLSETQLAELCACVEASPRRYAEGEVLVRSGERDFPVFVVLAGEIEMVDYTGGEPKTLVVHHRGQFTGDISHLTGSTAVVSAVARRGCEVFVIPRAVLGKVLNRCATLSDLILQAFIARRQLLHQSSEFTGLRVIGSRYSQDTFRVRDFLSKNRALFTWVDVETDPQVNELLKQFGITEADTPVVACGYKVVLRNPSNRELADAIGIRQVMEHTVFDLAVVGAGPAGLAAAVYAASEGLETVVLEHTAPGGQAGASMRIENYLGFPTGITGSELTGRAELQARKFGAHLSIPSRVESLAFENNYPVLRLDDGETLTARCLLIATGAEYRRLEAPGFEAFEGSGVYYAATPNEAQICSGEEVLVVGGGNSAGQAAVFLASHVRKVLLVIRGNDLYKSMSSYLVHRIEQTPNIELLCRTTIRRMSGNGHLETVEIVSAETGEERCVRTPGVFSFIGALPRTDWLPAEIERDAKGFIRTGPDLATSSHWSLPRQPFLLETSQPGVFAAGDVRSGSAKRVAAAVGEGAMAVQLIHQYLSSR